MDVGRSKKCRGIGRMAGSLDERGEEGKWIWWFAGLHDTFFAFASSFLFIFER